MAWMKLIKKQLSRNSPLEGKGKKSTSSKSRRSKMSHNKIVSSVPSDLGSRRAMHDDSYSTMSLSQDDRSDFGDACPCPPLHLVPSKKKYEIAIVACGEFWNPQRRFQRVDGVKRVVVGYTGGGYETPSAGNLQDQTNALFIEYNPKKVSYLDILQMWCDNDTPFDVSETINDRSALFVTDTIQRQQAIGFLSMLAKSRPNEYIHVDIEPATTFYQAEEYQQDYMIKQARACKEQFIKWANDEAPTGLCAILE